ncbi:MAG TPA: bifunctional DNA primase/polymerase [Acidimicrobiales bacterium]|nr:bifunctional DNA primase/polymerase [Acidimicrobiales bacterium]
MTRIPETVTGELQAHAIAYAQAGLEIFAVHPKTKEPMKVSTYGRGPSQTDATTDVEIVRAWWEQWPDALIGHRLPEQYVILDIDPRHGGDSTWKALGAEVGGWPKTREHRSGRDDGGTHLWWLRPDDDLSVRHLDEWAREHGTGEKVGTRWSCGIDLLQRNHRYTILPPSPHPATGKPYFWVPGQGLEMEPVDHITHGREA